MTSTVAVQRAVFKSDLPAPARHIMLTLAALADFKTGVIPDEHTPSLSEIADATDLARSSVAKFLNVLEGAGWVERDRPDVVAARTEGAKTVYRLKIGGSPSRGPDLVRHADQGTTKPSPSRGPGVVRDTDRPSPPHGRIRGRDLKVSTDTQPSTSHSQARTARKPHADGTKRGTRLPDEFAVTDAMKAWVREHAPLARPVDHDMFCDHWRGQSGQRAVKADWVATWRNWMRRVQENKTAQARRPGAAPVTTRHIDQLTPEQRAARNPFTGAVHASQVAEGAS